MSKLSFDALAERADQVATEDLLNSINGGTENDCHPEEHNCNISDNRSSVIKGIINIWDWMTWH